MSATTRARRQVFRAYEAADADTGGGPLHCACCGLTCRPCRDGERTRPACPGCGWVAYRNPAPGVAVLVTRLMPKPGGGLHKVVEVDNLVVRADQRGQRIGRRLLAAVVEWSRQRRAVQVEAVVGEGDARRFYESFGFAASVDRLVLAA